MPDYAKNHVVPAALLRGFADSTGRLCMFLVKKRCWFRNQLPEKVATNSKFYWVEGAEDPAVLEKGLGTEVDGPAAAAFERLRESPRLPNQTEVANLLKFIAFQMVRVPAFREWQRQSLKDSIPSLLADDLTRYNFEFAKEYFGDPGISYGEFQSRVRSGIIPVALSRNEELQSMTQMAEAIVPWLRRRRWSVRIVPLGAPPLVSSDHPVKSITPNAEGFTVTTGRIAWPNTEIFLALSKHLLLHGRFSPRVVSALTPAAIRNFNFATSWGATRIFSEEPNVEGFDPPQPA